MKPYDAMVESHIEYAESIYGEEACENMNLGWATDESGHFAPHGTYASKVYGHGVVETTFDLKTYAVLGHSHEDF